MKFSQPLSTVALLLAASAAVLPVSAPAFAAESTATPTSVAAEEKALEQKLSETEPIAEGRTEISQGHVDMGPKFVDGKWTLMFHDDHADTPAWRRPADVVLKGDDTALLPKPDDDRYSFIDAKAGEQVYVIPQTEMDGVVWPGWNTQDPEVVSKLGRGVTLTLDKVEGPGQFSLYLENGNFSAPQVLWNSDKSGGPQDIWVDPNTHTHANWVFTKPGAYFLTVTAHAGLADGTKVSDTQRLQFAVGSGTSADQVFEAASALGEATSHPANLAPTDASSTDTASQNSSAVHRIPDTAIWWIAGSIILLLAVTERVFSSYKNHRAAQQKAKDQLK